MFVRGVARSSLLINARSELQLLNFDTARNYDESKCGRDGGVASDAHKQVGKKSKWAWHAMRNTLTLKCNLFSLLHAHNATHAQQAHTQTETRTHAQAGAGGRVGGGRGRHVGAFM